MKKIKGVILDVDGTLIDSNDAHANAWLEIFHKHGYQTNFEQVRSLIGKGGDKLIPEVTGGIEKDSHEGKKLGEERGKLFKQKYLPKIKAFPQTQELLEHMKKAGLKMVIASSAQEDELESLLKIAHADKLVKYKTSSDDVENSKPDPDIIVAAFDKIGCEPNEVIMLGDTPYDIEAATKAGVKTIALRCGGWQDQDLAGAAAIYNDPADLLSNYDSSLLA